MGWSGYTAEEKDMIERRCTQHWHKIKERLKMKALTAIHKSFTLTDFIANLIKKIVNHEPDGM